MTNLYVVDAGAFLNWNEDGIEDYAIELLSAASRGQARYLMTRYYPHLTFTSPMKIRLVVKDYEPDTESFGDFGIMDALWQEALAVLHPEQFDDIRALDELDQLNGSEDPYLDLFDRLKTFFETDTPRPGPDFHPFGTVGDGL